MTPPKTPTILVVDDDPGLVILIEGALRVEEKWNVASASSGADALAWLQNNWADLLLLDLKLHDIEGREFIGTLQDAGRTVPFIIITGQGDERVAVEMMKRGALDYLVKDASFIEFVPMVVRRALERLGDEQKLVEAEAAASESRSITQSVLNSLSSLIEMSPDAIFVNQHDRITFINAAGLRLFGANSPGQLIGKSLFDFFPESRHAVIREGIERLLAGGGMTPLTEEKLVRLDGVVRAVEVLAATSPQGPSSAIQLVVRDISERKRDELRRHLQYETSRLLAASASVDETLPRLLQTLGEAMQWTVGEFWELSGEPGGRRVVHSWHAPGKTLAAFVRQSRKLLLSTFKGFPGQVLATRKPQWISDITQCPDFLRKDEAARAGLRSALAFPILLDQELCGVVVFLTHPATEPDEDLLEMFVALGRQIGQFMERKKFEEALRNSEERLRRTLDNMMEGCQTIGFDWRYLYVNKAAARHGRRLPGELLGRTLTEVYPGIREAHIFARLEDCMRNRSKSHVETEFIYPEGDSAWFQLSIQPVPEGIFILSLDITERKKLERELLDLSEHKQREFGHDLHDGLGQRLTGLEMLSHGLAEDLKGHDRTLVKQAQRLNRELRETVTQTRLISHSLAPVPLEGEGLMRGLMELAASTSRIGAVDCRFICDPPVCIHEATTAIHLYRIAQETVNNALKHGRAKKIQITLGEHAGRLELTVENDGCPMPPLGARPTDGMGLNIMRYRAEMIGASLSVESPKRKGVRVTCTLRRKI